MYYSQSTQRYSWKQFFRSCLFGLGLLVLINFFGCFHTSQVIEDNDAASQSQSKIRPIDIDTNTAEKIGREALRKYGYEEIIKLAEKAGFVEYKSDIIIQLVSYESTVATGFVPVFSRYAVAAAVASQADSPLPGPADIAAVGVVVIGLVDAGLLDGYLFNTFGGWLFSKPSPKFETPTNQPQCPPTAVPPGWRIREMPPTEQYPNGYWKMEKPMNDGSWQPINPSTMKPGTRPQTHIEFPPGKPE